MKSRQNNVKRVLTGLFVGVFVGLTGCAGLEDESGGQRYGALATGLAEDCSSRFTLLVTGRDSREAARNEVLNECRDEANGRYECDASTFTDCGAIVYGAQDFLDDAPNCVLVSATGGTKFNAERPAEDRCERELRRFGDCEVVVSECNR